MKKIFLIVLGLFISISAYSQSQDVITEILESSEATFGQVCYISAVMQSLVSDDTSYDDAVQAIYENGQIPYIAESSQSVPLIDAAYIFSFMILPFKATAAHFFIFIIKLNYINF